MGDHSYVMTVSLYLMRHAKTLPGTVSGRDHDRSLSERGHRQMGEMAVLFRDILPSQTPLTVLCSTAQRAKQTWQGLQLKGPEVHFLDALYLASADTIFRLIDAHMEPADRSSILVICHNPGLRDLNSALAQSARISATDRALAHQRFPTSWIACYRIHQVDWHQQLSFDQFLAPRENP